MLPLKPTVKRVHQFDALIPNPARTSPLPLSIPKPEAVAANADGAYPSSSSTLRIFSPAPLPVRAIPVSDESKTGPSQQAASRVHLAASSLSPSRPLVHVPPASPLLSSPSKHTSRPSSPSFASSSTSSSSSGDESSIESVSDIESVPSPHTQRKETVDSEDSGNSDRDGDANDNVNRNSKRKRRQAQNKAENELDIEHLYPRIAYLERHGVRCGSLRALIKHFKEQLDVYMYAKLLVKGKPIRSRTRGRGSDSNEPSYAMCWKCDGSIVVMPGNDSPLCPHCHTPNVYTARSFDAATHKNLNRENTEKEEEKKLQEERKALTVIIGRKDFCMSGDKA